MLLFGGIATGNSQATFLGALEAAIGIGIQNIPEGAALSMPIGAAGASRWKLSITVKLQQL